MLSDRSKQKFEAMILEIEEEHNKVREVVQGKMKDLEAKIPKNPPAAENDEEAFVAQMQGFGAPVDTGDAEFTGEAEQKAAVQLYKSRLEGEFTSKAKALMEQFKADHQSQLNYTEKLYALRRLELKAQAPQQKTDLEEAIAYEKECKLDGLREMYEENAAPLLANFKDVIEAARELTGPEVLDTSKHSLMLAMAALDGVGNICAELAECSRLSSNGYARYIDRLTEVYAKYLPGDQAKNDSKQDLKKPVQSTGSASHRLFPSTGFARTYRSGVEVTDEQMAESAFGHNPLKVKK